MYQDIQRKEAGKAFARSQGVPTAVSLNEFDPKRDIHPADEVNVTGWINTDCNFQLTLTTMRKLTSSDRARRMFVLSARKTSAMRGKRLRGVVFVKMISPQDYDESGQSMLKNL